MEIQLVDCPISGAVVPQTNGWQWDCRPNLRRGQWIQSSAFKLLWSSVCSSLEGSFLGQVRSVVPEKSKIQNCTQEKKPWQKSSASARSCPRPLTRAISKQS